MTTDLPVPPMTAAGVAYHDALRSIAAVLGESQMAYASAHFRTRHPLGISRSIFVPYVMREFNLTPENGVAWHRHIWPRH